MRSDAKASTQRQATGLGRIFRGANATRRSSPDAAGIPTSSARRVALPLCVLAGVLALALAAIPASGSTTRFLQETFGSANEPSFPADRGIVVDQATNEVYVLDATEDSLYRFNSDGSASNFSALGSNVIGGLSIPSSRKESQIAIDESGTATDGNIYVAGGSAHRIDIFNSEGEYEGQLTEYSGGALGETCGVAVDGSGNVYVGDYSHGVHVYEPTANPPVNGDNSATYTTAANPCTLAAGAGATAGFLFVDRYNGELLKLDAATGEAKYTIATGASTVSVDPSNGHVFSARNTGGSSTVDEYDASGATEASLVSSFKPGSTTEGVAANGAAEEVYVARSSTENVEVYGAAKVVPDIVTEEPTANTGTRATFAGTVNPDGVELDECLFEWGEGSGGAAYTETTPCAETPAEIGTGTSPVAVHADISGLKPQGTKYHYRLVATNPNATINGSNKNFTTPNTVIAEAATGVTSTAATLHGTVNPDTATISECVFEWGPKKDPFEEGPQVYPEATACVPGPGGISGESPVAVEAGVSGLHPGTPYAYRLRAAYPTGPVIDPNKSDGEGLVVQPLGPSIDGVWSKNVTRTEATLKAKVNPEGKATTYRFDWGKTTAYGNSTPEPEGSAGSGSAAKEVTVFLDELEPNTTYHYRLVATNADATDEGVDHSITTYAPAANNTDCPNQVFRTGPSASLPDCRAFEMVSPVDKDGQDAYVTEEEFSYGGEPTPPSQSAIDGSKVAFTSRRAFGDQPSAPPYSVNLARRGAGGWATEGINPPWEDGFLPEEAEPGYLAFSADLSTSWVRPLDGLPLAPGATAGLQNLYRRDNATGAYTAINVGEPTVSAWLPEFGGSSEDGSYVLFGERDKLAPEALPPAAVHPGYRQFYIWHEGELHAVGILPNGETFEKENQAGALGGHFQNSSGSQNNARNVISDDGSRVFWTAIESNGAGQIYMREHAEQGVVAGECVEPGKACTIPVSGSVSSAPAKYWTAAPDGSKALFSFVGSTGLTTGALYLFDVDTETPTQIAASALGVAGASDDLSIVYFASKLGLAAGATAGKPNLYLYDEGTITFLGPLSDRDTNPVLNPEIPRAVSVWPAQQAAKTTPDGRRIAFVSNSTELAEQVGYDNIDVNSGQPAYEVYTYEAGGELRCASCNPSGARPDAVTEAFIKRVTAAWILPYELEYYPRRFLSDDGGRLFFNSYDALVPEDVNGAQDVYEWEAPGSGDCSETSPAFSELNGGCVSLLSSGQTKEESSFVDASASGGDVFIRTDSTLLPQDPGSWDVYDVRAGGGFPPPAPRTASCEGEACQNPPAAPQFANPASANFHGAGNPQPTQDCGARARRAIKLSHRARRLRRAARRSHNARRVKRMHRKARVFAKRAHRLSVTAKRCRRANRRVGR